MYHQGIAAKQVLLNKNGLGVTTVALFYPEDKLIASRYVREAIPLMMKNDIVPNPCNFALWYSYVSNRDLDLKKALDNTIEEEGTCPPPVGRKLFETHVIKEEIELQQNLQDSLGSVINELLGDVSNTSKGATDFAKNLETSLDTLLNDTNPETIQKTVETLIAATQETNAAMSTFQNQINTAELEIQTLRAQLEERERDATTDQLCGISNRRAFDQKLYELFASDIQATLVLVDLDHFKKLNDTYGHVLGDKVLQGVGEILKKFCPTNGMAARYGGEEFAYLIEGDIEQGFELAEKTRLFLKNLSLKKKNSTEVIDNITASFGVAQRQEGDFPEQLVEQADKALYSAKDSGRNQVIKAA